MKTTHTMIWQPAAMAGLLRIRATDPQATKDVRMAIAALTATARPPDSTPLGTAGLRRLRVGDTRVLYEIDDVNEAIHVLTIGRAHR